VAEAVLTFMFLMIIQGATDRRTPQGFAPIAIGLGLTLIHLISIPVTNTSVNPARSTGPAIFVGGWRLRSFGCSGLRRSWELRSRALCIRGWREGPVVPIGSLPLAQEHDDESGSNPGC